MTLNSKSILVIIAHPDDEIFLSGTLCLLEERGYSTHLVSVTDGGGSTSPFSTFLSEPHDLGILRRHELAMSALVLRITSTNVLSFEDIPESKWNDSVKWDSNLLEMELANKISNIEPAIIFTHGPMGGYGHPAHRQVFESVMSAANSCAYDNSIYSFSGRVDKVDLLWRYFDQASDVIIDVRRYRDRRIAALSYYQSQKNVFLSPIMPLNLRTLARSTLPLLASFSKRARRRLPIYSPASFINRFPREGLVLQRRCSLCGHDLLTERLGNDPLITILPNDGLERKIQSPMAKF